GPISILNIILNLSDLEISPLQSGHLILFCRIKSSTPSFSILSGTSIFATSCISLSALKELEHFLHLTIGSVKLVKCPEAMNTFLLIICDPSISSMLSLLTNSLLHKSKNLFFILTPLGPYSQNPAFASEYNSLLGK